MRLVFANSIHVGTVKVTTNCCAVVCPEFATTTPYAAFLPIEIVFGPVVETAMDAPGVLIVVCSSVALICVRFVGDAGLDRAEVAFANPEVVPVPPLRPWAALSNGDEPGLVAGIFASVAPSVVDSKFGTWVVAGIELPLSESVGSCLPEAIATRPGVAWGRLA